MIWNRLASIDDLPTEGLQSTSELKATLLRNAEIVWLISRDDGTPVFAAGLYRPIALCPRRILWMVPYAALRPFDWRGMKRLVSILASQITDLWAAVEPSNHAAIRTVEHLNFELVSAEPEERLYRWKL